MRSTPFPFQQIHRFYFFCQHGITILFLITVLHLLIVFWSYYQLPNSFWMMERSQLQDPLAMLASWVFLTLNFPVTYLGLLIRNYWNLPLVTVYPWILINSLFWAGFIYGLWRLVIYIRDLRKTILIR